MQFCLIQGFSISRSEGDLASLGLTEKGDVLTLKSFCTPRNNGASGELANLIKSTGAERKSKGYVG